MSVPRVFVTGMGVVSCLGNDVESFWAGLCEGRNGMAPLTRFDLEGIKYLTGGEARSFSPLAFEECGMSLAAQFAAEAGRQALEPFPVEFQDHIALVGATNFGPAELFEEALSPGYDAGPLDYRLGRGFFSEETARIAAHLRVGGPQSCISLSCASGNAAIAHAAELIRSGRAEAALAVGYDSIQRISWAGLSCLRVMALPSDEGAARVRPFDANRSGTIFSEGAACLLLESEYSIEETGSTVFAELVGAGLNNNAYHLTHADKEGMGTAVAMQMALDQAGLSAAEIDHINAHGTGTKLNDIIETRAIEFVFGPRSSSIPVVSNKGGLGHGMGAASAFEAVASVLSLAEGRIPPTVNLEEQDAECALDVVRDGPRDADLRYVLSNSAGIGGSNAVVVFGRPDTGGER